jgi:hypothetical protein
MNYLTLKLPREPADGFLSLHPRFPIKPLKTNLSATDRIAEHCFSHSPLYKRKIELLVFYNYSVVARFQNISCSLRF